MDTWVVPGYREERVLGTGGAGRVVLATYTATGAYVAIKYLKDELRRDPEFLAAFRAEARVMVELDNPHIVRLYEYVESMAGAAIVMELVDGVSLRRLLAEHGATSPEAALVVLKGSLLGMSAAHALGVVHRDYKPENVLVQADGTTKLSDFGIAARSGAAGAHTGTPSYMAPEQWEGARATPATDVYAATCVFFECLTGHRPYRAEHLLALRHQHKNAPIPLLEVPSAVRGLVARGMAKNPADRPMTARAFLAELETAALEAYGPEWEQRGRRHLAELATLLALLFPLADPPPQVSSAVAQTRLGRPKGRDLRGRLQRTGPRIALGSGALMAAIIIAVVLNMGRPSLTLGENGPLTPRATPTQAFAQPPPGGGGSDPPARPSTGDPTGSDPAAGAPETDDPTAAGEGRPTLAPAANEAGSEGGGASGPERSPSPPTSSPEPPSSSPSTGKTPPGPSPRPSPPRTPTPEPPPAAVEVAELRILSFDGDTATVRVDTTGPGRVALTVRFAQGRTADDLSPVGAPRTLTLAGRTTHTVTTGADLAAPECGTRVVRRVTVATTPGAPGGARSATATVSGPACPPPRVESLSIDSWNGRRAVVRVTTDGTGPVTLNARFSLRRGGETRVVDTATRELSGRTRYSRVLTGAFPEIPCGRTAVLGVSVGTVPAAPGGTVTRETRVSGPECAPPRLRILSWDGSTARVRITTSTADPVRVTANFRQRVEIRGDPATRTAVRSVVVQGRNSYVVALRARFTAPRCGTDVRTVTVSSVPAAGNGSPSRTVNVPVPACEADRPDPEPEGEPESKPESKPDKATPSPDGGSAGDSAGSAEGGPAEDPGDGRDEPPVIR